MNNYIATTKETIREYDAYGRLIRETIKETTPVDHQEYGYPKYYPAFPSVTPPTHLYDPSKTPVTYISGSCGMEIPCLNLS